mmetsp:Transcript_11739/g.27185  ORF Transcript_11739/g.27185 Transcript_11739/m.27185 type:complete len:230 (-) Transcript_11739:1138-1827(-)
MGRRILSFALAVSFPVVSEKYTKSLIDTIRRYMHSQMNIHSYKNMIIFTHTRQHHSSTKRMMGTYTLALMRFRLLLERKRSRFSHANPNYLIKNGTIRGPEAFMTNGPIGLRFNPLSLFHTTPELSGIELSIRINTNSSSIEFIVFPFSFIVAAFNKTTLAKSMLSTIEKSASVRGASIDTLQRPFSMSLVVAKFTIVRQSSLGLIISSLAVSLVVAEFALVDIAIGVL